MKHLHILPMSLFSYTFIDFIIDKFDKNNHIFFLFGDFKELETKVADNIVRIDKKPITILRLITQMNKTDKIYFHSLFNHWLIRILLMQPWLLKKSFWLIWGGDLYYYNTREKGLKSDILEYMRALVIRNIGGLITHVKGDYDLAKFWYGTRGKYYYSFMYPTNLYRSYGSEFNKIDDNKIYIQLGNSGDPCNNHIEILEKLKKYSEKNIEIISPLSYGDDQYVKLVENCGKQFFGDKFRAIVKYMPYDDYLELLNKIDIAIFNHKRQQAMGNITSLIGLGKKVYIRNDITTWEFCLDHDLKVFTSNSEFDDLFEKMDEKIMQNNIQNVKTRFSEEKLIEDWKKIFNEGEADDEN